VRKKSALAHTFVKKQISSYVIRIATCRVQEDILDCDGTWFVCNLDDKGKLFGVLQPEETMAAEAVRSASRMCCIRNPQNE